MKKSLRFLIFALCFCFVCLPCASAFEVVDKTAGYYVADYANVITPETENYIINNNNSLVAQTGAQIVVVVIDFLDGANIEEYSTQLFNEWEIGDKEKNNGLLLLLAVGEQEYWATQGSGISKALTASLIDEYLYNYLEPEFAAAKYDAGVRSIFDALVGWYERYYGVEIIEEEPVISAPEGMETIDTTLTAPAADTNPLDELPQEHEPFTKGGIIGRIAGGFLIGLVVLAVAVLLIVSIPRSISLKKKGYNYSVFNRAFWSSSHRPPPPRQTQGRTVTGMPIGNINARPQPSRPVPPRPVDLDPQPRQSSGGFGSGNGINRAGGSAPRSSSGGFGSTGGRTLPRANNSTRTVSRPSSNHGLGGSTRGGGAGRRPR